MEMLLSATKATEKLLETLVNNCFDSEVKSDLMQSHEVVDVSDGDGVTAEVADGRWEEVLNLGNDLVGGGHFSGTLASDEFSRLLSKK